MYTLLKVIRSLAFTIAFFLAVTALLLFSPANLLNPRLRKRGWRHDQLPSNRAYMLVTKFALWIGGFDVRMRRDRSDAEGMKLLERGPCIIAYTHSSNLDPLVVIVTSKCAPRFIFKKELLRVPIFGWVMWLYGQIAIDRKNRDQAIESMKKAVRTLAAEGQSVAIAPEGTRSRTGELLDFKRGPFYLAHESHAPCVPIVIRGAFELLPPKSKLFDAGPVYVTALKPIRGASVDELAQRVRAAVETEVARCKKEEAACASESAAKQRRRNESVKSTLPAIALLTAVFYGIISALF